MGRKLTHRLRGCPEKDPNQRFYFIECANTIFRSLIMSRLDCGISRRRFVQRTAFTAVGLNTWVLFAAPQRSSAAGVPVSSDRDANTSEGFWAPFAGMFSLDAGNLKAATEGKLQIRGPEGTAAAQLLETLPDGRRRLCWLGADAPESPNLRFRRTSKTEPVMRVRRNPDTGQFIISESATLVLQYNYAAVQPGAVLASVAEANLKYAVPRSDYIHPLYGLQGEILTKDWSKDHPHHRGIYWAWPEVDWRGERGDLHALQKVFARPTGKCDTLSGPVFAQVQAENLWKWEDRDPIVREEATIRVFRATAVGRVIDLILHFEALVGPVLVARRGAAHYGGLNLRLNQVKGQQITKHTDPETISPRKAWSDLSGRFSGAEQPAGVTVFQHAANPDYPGDWIEYPDLNWLQPTFPSVGTRYEMSGNKPLVLRFRLLIHPGGTISETLAAAHWQAANSAHSTLS
jgi:hypothetical protein